MNLAQTWLDAWNTRAENRRQLIAQRLSRQAAGPAMTAIRAQYLKGAQAALNNRKTWAQAYQKHVEALAHIVTQNVSQGGKAKAPSSKGSLGD